MAIIIGGKKPLAGTPHIGGNGSTAAQFTAKLFQDINGKSPLGNANQKVGKHPNLADAWQHKDPEVLKQWEINGPSKLQWVHEQTLDNGSYWITDRALQINADAKLWVDAAEKESGIKLSPEWKKAIDYATLMVDIGNDGTGANGYPTIVRDTHLFEPGMAAKVAALVGASQGIYVEDVFTNLPKVRARFQFLGKDTQSALDAFYKNGPTKKMIPQEVASFTTENKALAAGTLKELTAASFLDTKQGREQFGLAMFITKGADQSRGQILQAAGGDLAAPNLDKVSKHTLFDSMWNGDSFRRIEGVKKALAKNPADAAAKPEVSFQPPSTVEQFKNPVTTIPVNRPQIISSPVDTAKKGSFREFIDSVLKR